MSNENNMIIMIWYENLINYDIELLRSITFQQWTVNTESFTVLIWIHKFFHITIV